MEELHQLSEAIRQYEEGDLLAVAEIREIAETLQATTEDKQTAAGLAEIITTAEEIVLQGPSEENSARFQKLGRELIAQPEEEAARAKQTEPQKPQELQEPPGEGLEEVLIEDAEILSSFLVEAHDHLDDIEERILDLEKSYDEQTIHDIFRSMHTIKGVSSFIGLSKIKSFSHGLETVLNAMRTGELETDDEIVDILLNGSDVLQQMVLDIEAQAEELGSSSGKAVVYEGRVATGEIDRRLAPYLQQIESGGAAPTTQSDVGISGVSASAGAEQPAHAAPTAPQPAQQPSAAEAKPEKSLTEELISPEMVQKFVEETSDLVDTAERSMLELEKDPASPGSIEEAFRAIHTVKGNAGFFGFAMLEKMCMGIEGILDTLRTGARTPDAQIINLLLQSIDGLNVTLKKVHSGEIKPGELADGGVDAEEAVASKEVGDYKPLGDMLVEMGIATQDAVDQALDVQRMRLGEILIDQGAAKEEEIQEALQKQGKAEPEKKDQFANYRIKRRDIRVDTERLDKLFDLMGELITAEAMVINNPELEPYDLPNFERSANYLSKISREMQEITMAMRMIPLEGLFSKMRRLVRDLSKKFEKPVNLEISGEDTEMDRTVMEEISDPLVHIIRNALDHGIESAEKRRAAGKPENGTVQLSAGYEGNEIWITVADDGGGLKREAILERSVERGLVQGNPEDMKDEDVWKLIFEPGFSTAEKVSEISGRGVGMDVVKKNIEKLRGKIDIQSVEGQGSTFVLKIPLTLAIIDGITFTVGPQLYSLPITDVIQFHKAAEVEITQTNTENIVINLRNEVIPVVKMYEFFNIHTSKQRVEDGIVIVAQARDRKLAILVDEIIGYRQIVIKSLPAYMKDIRALSGCSIMSDGKVSLIVDTGALISYVLE
ncbi:MAG: Hpt domain-containing protein [Spirochaetota bacterium]